jgi:hypothetical protein
MLVVASPKPCLGECLRTQLRVLKGRPVQTIILVMLLTAVAVAPDILDSLPSIFATLSGELYPIWDREFVPVTLRIVSGVLLFLCLFPVTAFSQLVLNLPVSSDGCSGPGLVNGQKQ